MSGRVTTVSVWLLSSTAQSVNAEIHTANPDGSPTSTILGSVAISAPADSSFTAHEDSGAFTSGPDLTDDTTYALVLTPRHINSHCSPFWSWSNSGAPAWHVPPPFLPWRMFAGYGYGPDRQHQAFVLSVAADLSASATPVSGTEGQQFSGQVASFADADTQPVGDYSATITWGDGQSSQGRVTQTSSGQYAVGGSHTYSEEGSEPVSVQITDADGTSANANATATVVDAALSASGTSINSQPAFSGPVATFSDANPNGGVADFAASIDWGDGSASPGTVSANGNGGFDVTGSHSYAQTGPYTVKVHVADDGGNTADATSQILVYQFAAGNGGSFVIGDGSASVGSQVAYWGSRWAKDNPLSSGGAPASFKGFAESPSANPPACGGSYSTGPGNSSQPPASVPAYMGVYVSSAVSQHGSKISGDINQIVVVKTDAGYQPDPGQPGTGQVVAQVC